MKRWFAVYTKPRQEEIAEQNLCRQGFDCYWPRIRREQIRRGKRVQLIEAMFPRYLFVRFHPGQDNISSIRYTKGVSRLVGFGGEPARVPDEIIRILQESSTDPSGLYIELLPEPKQGEMVSVVDGALAGLQGIFVEKCGEERVIILLNIIGEQNRVALRREQIALTAR